MWKAKAHRNICHKCTPTGGPLVVAKHVCPKGTHLVNHNTNMLPHSHHRVHSHSLQQRWVSWRKKLGENQQEWPTVSDSPNEGDVTPPLKKVLAVVWGKVSVLHLLDICPSCKCLRIKINSPWPTWSGVDKTRLFGGTLPDCFRNLTRQLKEF